MTAIMDLSFPGQRTATATSCIPHDSVYMPGPRAGKSENGFFCCDTWLQIFQNDSEICEAEVTLTPLINKICKPWEGNNIAVNSWKSVCCSYPEKTGYGHTDQIFMLPTIEWSVEYQGALHI